MLFRSHFTSILAIFVLTTSAWPVIAQDRVKLERPLLVMVTRPKSPVKAETAVVATLNPGEIVSVTALQEGWFWVPIYRGWVWQHHILPLDKAIEFFTAKIKEKPTSHAHHHRGLAWEALGDREAALTDLSSAIELDPRNASALINRGNVYRVQSNLDKAIADYSTALRIEPRNVQALNNRGLAWSDRDEWTKAIRDLSRAVQIDPKFADAYNNRGVARRMQGDLDRALADYDYAIKLAPQYSEAFANRGYIRKEKRQFKDALADYETAIRLSPTARIARNDLAWLLATCSDPEIRDGQQAIEHAVRACELSDPPYGDPNLLDTLAASHAESGDFANAVKWGKKAVDLADVKARTELTTRLKLYQSKQPYHAQSR